MSDLDQLNMLENKAAALDGELNDESQAGGAGGELIELPPLRDEIADMLDYLVMAGSFLLPTMGTHYSHEANLKIADALIKLADRYGYDLRESLLSQNSVVLLWVGVAYTVGMPAGACFMDYKAMKQKASEKEVKDAPSPQSNQTDSQPNSVVTGV